MRNSGTCRPAKNCKTITRTAAIAAVAYSPDGTRLATGSWDHSIKIWDAQTRRAVIKISGVHTANVNSVDFSSDGRLILSSSDDKTCRICNVADGRPTGVVLKHDAVVLTARFNRDASKIVTGCADGHVRLWTAADGRPLLDVAAHSWAVASAVVSPDGKFLATGSGDNTAAIWNAETGASGLSTRRPYGRRFLRGLHARRCSIV
ncbi:MAG: hypothetical protein QM775_10705 [Pirellulales bacterium]